MSLVNIGLVDDHPIVLAGLSELVGELQNKRVLATGTCAEDALAMAERGGLRLIVMDLNMKGPVLETIGRIAALPNAPAVLVFSASEKVEDCCAALSRGASGYVIKGSSESELFQAIDIILEGREYISPSLAVRVFRQTQARDKKQDVVLSFREDQIVNQLLNGASNRDIATRLRLSEKTIKYYMTQIMQKLDAKNRLEVALAVQRDRMERQPAKV
ncbi:MAG: response regulator transcription factor [Cereibacter changlensis]|jgi:DNA-binding NarL/FixJ family response regulator|uniref:Response regulator transcription factor n=1 Tax=Cereibacter changlensis TaxID=402884 RepID=A0A4U0Z1E7_9RHOB|nr:response regulator transcription factor [Cereibacter changlensis]MBZ4689393.1 liaR [Cereibacter sp.]TKA98045.1 response regulator transcription factor [Cereibacter changlensis]